jgi:hypothetical protein
MGGKLNEGIIMAGADATAGGADEAGGAADETTMDMIEDATDAVDAGAAAGGGGGAAALEAGAGEEPSPGKWKTGALIVGKKKAVVEKGA